MALNKQKLINGVRSRKPANEAEGICYDVLADDGWTLTKRGWPDYFAFKGDEVIVVEVKKGMGQNLKREQHKTLQAMIAHGFKGYVFTPDTGLQPYGEWKTLYTALHGEPPRWS